MICEIDAVANVDKPERPSMHKPKSDALAFSMLVLSCALVAWTGIAGPIFSDSLRAGLDKWQTLLASIIALIAAYFAARPVYRQLAEQRRQSAAAAVTMIVKAAEAIEKERDILRKGRDDLFRLDGILEAIDQFSWHDIYQTWPDQAYDLIETCDALLREMHRFRERNPKITSTQQCRIEAIAVLEQVRSGIHDIRHIFRQDHQRLELRAWRTRHSERSTRASA
jgi:hypothetical protein